MTRHTEETQITQPTSIELGRRAGGDPDTRTGGASGNPPVSSARSATKTVEAIRNLAAPLAKLAAAADALPEEYRAVAFAEFVRFLLRTDAGLAPRTEAWPVPVASHTGGGVNEPVRKRENASSGIETATSLVERAVAVPQGALLRVLQIDADKSVKVLTRIEGRSISERQIKLAQIVCYVREKGLGEMKTDIETLRAACITQGQYDRANFAANFRRDGSILEAPTPGSKERLFILSRNGVESAAMLLRQLAAN